ncbi:MAG TPA: IS3 family transposase [Chloroflexota bacterium]|nr:IS3 family transposase [Chloroflexota bacterium]
MSLQQLCRLLGVSRSWFYDRRTQPVSDPDEIALRDAVEAITLAFPGYGYRRVTKQLQRDGWVVNHKRVLRSMRDEALLCQLKRRFIPTTNSRHAYRRYPNLLDAPDQAWVADITYIRLPTGFVYLATLLDAHSRYCVGWQLSRLIDTSLTLGALERALTTRDPQPGLIHHSDQGVQYASDAYVDRLDAVAAQMSMAAVGNPYENAKAERFFRTLKCEEVYLNQYDSFTDAETNIGHFIDDIYNARRLHSRLRYLPPAEFEARCAASRREDALRHCPV